MNKTIYYDILNNLLYAVSIVGIILLQCWLSNRRHWIWGSLIPAGFVVFVVGLNAWKYFWVRAHIGKQSLLFDLDRDALFIAFLLFIVPLIIFIVCRAKRPYIRAKDLQHLQEEQKNK